MEEVRRRHAEQKKMERAEQQVERAEQAERQAERQVGRAEQQAEQQGEGAGGKNPQVMGAPQIGVRQKMMNARSDTRSSSRRSSGRGSVRTDSSRRRHQVWGRPPTWGRSR